MSHKQDDTLRDFNRRQVTFPAHKIKEVLPEFFREEYPNLLKFLEEYYHFEDGDDAPSRLIHDLFYSRDITQTDLQLLAFIEDELLLGQQYFQGFADKRQAAKYSNTLYRSKGTKFSIQQFFRTFFSIDPDVVYTKENVFIVGEPASKIGTNSQKFLTNDKLYQTFALLIKSDLSISKWGEVYKLFVHPAGMYVGSQVQIVSEVVDLLTAPTVVPAPVPPIVVENLGLFSDIAVGEVTSIVDDPYVDSEGVLSRIIARFNIDQFTKAGYGDSDYTLQQIENQYQSLRSAQIASGPTLDDSDMDFSNNFFFETLDQDEHQWWSADSDLYYSKLDSAGWL